MKTYLLWVFIQCLEKTNKYGGSVAIHVSEDNKFKKRDDLNSNIESISTELVIPYVKPIIVISVYRPLGSLVSVFPI